MARPNRRSSTNLYGVALDSSGNLYIADFGNQRIRRIGADGTITTVAGNGQTGSNGDGGPAISAQMLSPRNLAIDPAGNIYVSEFVGHSVRRIAADGTITTFAGTGVAGFSGDQGPAVDAQLAFPAGLALDPTGALYIVDTGNSSIRKVQAATITTVCNVSNFNVPTIALSGIAADSTGGMYITEGIDSVVWLLSPSGALTLAAGILGSNTPSGDGGLALQTALIMPVDVAADTTGNLYISELHRVRSVAAATRIITTVAGDGTFGFSGDGAGATAAVLNGPVGLAIFQWQCLHRRPGQPARPRNDHRRFNLHRGGQWPGSAPALPVLGDRTGGHQRRPVQSRRANFRCSGQSVYRRQLQQPRARGAIVRRDHDLCGNRLEHRPGRR